MIPRADVEVVPVLPAAATYWMPAEGESIGPFRDVWRLSGVTHSQAAALVRREQDAVAALDAVAADGEDFDRRARAAERSGDFFGLEIGVAGLSYALAAIGCVPAASCRGHGGEGAWSYNPIVFTAVDRPRAEWLVPRVRRAKCGFGVGAGRENLLVIQGSSIVSMVQLAVLIVREAEVIPPPSGGPRPG